MTQIFNWPPVKARASLLDDELPSRSSRGALSGTDSISAGAPRRRLAQITVSSLAGNRDGAGLCASLKRLLDGGVNLVRVPCPPVNRVWDISPLRSARLLWTEGGDPLDWTEGPEPLIWFTGPALAATVSTVSGFDALTLSGLTPGRLVCRAYEVVRVFVDGESAGVSRAVDTVFADASGVAVIPLFEALPAGVVSIGDTETLVFRADEIRASENPLNADWYYSFSLREVFAGEIPVGATDSPLWA